MIPILKCVKLLVGENRVLEERQQQHGLCTSSFIAIYEITLNCLFNCTEIDDLGPMLILL